MSKKKEPIKERIRKAKQNNIRRKTWLSKPETEAEARAESDRQAARINNQTI